MSEPKLPGNTIGDTPPLAIFFPSCFSRQVQKTRRAARLDRKDLDDMFPEPCVCHLLCVTFVCHLCGPPLCATVTFVCATFVVHLCAPPLCTTFVRHLCAPPLCATFVCHLWLVSRKYRLGKPPPGGVCCLECYLHTSDRSRPRSCRSLPRRYDMLLCRICMVKIQRRDHVLQRRDHVLGHVDCSAPTRQHEAK